jgi:ubiquinone/menaquinone biosynthesis C-methylase UbiE
MRWTVMSATSLELPDANFNAVIDKGLLDAILCGDESIANAKTYCSEVSRVLKSGGVSLVITYGNPTTRMEILDNPEFGWKVTVETVAKPKLYATAPETANVHYVYSCRKA